jgi:hypothetical protein
MANQSATAYYAVPDPTSGDMTYWRRDKRGRIGPWPTRPPARWYVPVKFVSAVSRQVARLHGEHAKDPSLRREGHE